jgi:hypothetical protein
MPDRNLRTYLNHHLAAAVGWLEAVERLQAAEKGTPMARVLTELHAEVTADRQVLEELMARLKVTESETKKATAWLGEKLMRMFMPLNDDRSGALNLFETFEALSLGVEGRRAMWQALSLVAEGNPALQRLDYQLLMKRAEDQRARVEKMRMDVALRALRPAE